MLNEGAMLNEGKYGTWKTKVEFLLIREDLWQYVIGTNSVAVSESSAAVPGSSAATDTTASKTGDQNVRVTIGLFLEVG